MFNKILILIIAVIILAAGYFLLFPLQGANHEDMNLPVNLENGANVQIRDMGDAPEEYYSGKSRYSYGECQTDADCYNIGCSLEMCSSDESLLTTCDIGGDFPDKVIYNCGCIVDRCGWYEK